MQHHVIYKKQVETNLDVPVLRDMHKQYRNERMQSQRIRFGGINSEYKYVVKENIVQVR